MRVRRIACLDVKPDVVVSGYCLKDGKLVRKEDQVKQKPQALQTIDILVDIINNHEIYDAKETKPLPLQTTQEKRFLNYARGNEPMRLHESDLKLGRRSPRRMVADVCS